MLQATIHIPIGIATTHTVFPPFTCPVRLDLDFDFAELRLRFPAPPDDRLLEFVHLQHVVLADLNLPDHRATHPNLISWLAAN